MKEIYSKQITEPSFEELKEFAEWYNKKIGNYPVIVGGWAVYCYTKGLGSKDIDVVFVGDETKHVTLSTYFLTHGYSERKRSFFDTEFAKTINIQGGEVEIIIDAVSSKRTIIIEGRKVRIPWSWAIKYNRIYELKGATIYIPNIELLLVYKLGAVLGRNILLRTGIDFDYYRSKVWKDVYDAVSLSKLDMDYKKVGDFLVRSGLNNYRKEIIQIMEDNFDDEMRLLLRGFSLSRIKELLE